jgi:hypothetical protein
MSRLGGRSTLDIKFQLKITKNQKYVIGRSFPQSPGEETYGASPIQKNRPEGQFFCMVPDTFLCTILGGVEKNEGL